jgi:polar amino acid transport system substrate-binding protein
MKKIVKNIVCSIFILLCGSSLAYGDKTLASEKAELPKLTVLTEVYPPYQIVSKDGKVYGWSADKVKTLLAQAQIDYTLDILPWIRAYKSALLKPNTLLYSLLRTDSRENSFHWVAPLCSIDFSLYRLKSRTDIEVNTIVDAKKYQIAAQKGQASTEYLLSLGFDDKRELSVSYNNDNFIQMLVHDRVELIVLSTAHVQSLILTSSPHINEIEAIFPIKYLRKNLYLAASLSTSPVILKKLQKAYDELLPQFDSACHD